MLCQAVSQPIVSVRIFGKTELRTITNAACIFATGNNLTFSGDIVRRTMRCTVDPKCERPEMRRFKTLRPDLAMLRDRAALVVAGLTVLRAFHVAGSPSQGRDPIGTFEAWSSRVRDCLIWLGEPDPWLSTELIRADDPVIDANVAALTVWAETFPDPVTTKQVVDTAYQKSEQPGHFGRYVNDKLNSALRAVTDNTLNPSSLGMWVRSYKDRPIGGYLLRASEKFGHGHVKQWEVITLKNRGDDGGDHPTESRLKVKPMKFSCNNSGWG